ncbi:Transcription factor GTE6, partial [Mucuna pruriens]
MSCPIPEGGKNQEPKSKTTNGVFKVIKDETARFCVMDADPPQPQPQPGDYLEPFRVSVHQILTRVNKLEKQVTQVEQFYESTDNVQGNNSKGGSLVKDKSREKHLIGTKKPLQDASHTEAAAAKRMQELMRQFSTILRQASANTLQQFF